MTARTVRQTVDADWPRVVPVAGELVGGDWLEPWDRHEPEVSPRSRIRREIG